MVCITGVEMRELKGTEVAQSVFEDVRRRCRDFVDKTAVSVHLAVVLVGSDGASQSYVASKGKACDEMGFVHTDIRLPDSTSEAELISVVEKLNSDSSVHGILVQIPLPKHISEHRIAETIAPDKDVDGLNPVNLGKLLLGQSCLVPCTPAGILEILSYYHIETKGTHAVVIGRSAIVGKPMASLLMNKRCDATVTVCHSKTKNLAQMTASADILVVAMGKPLCVTRDMVKPGAVVIDVGINRIPDSTKKRGYRIVGDVDYSAVADMCSAITPVPGGVGPMTIAMLMKNTLQACMTQYGEHNCR